MERLWVLQVHLLDSSLLLSTGCAVPVDCFLFSAWLLQISVRSGIPYERVEIAKGYGTFPHEMSVVEIHDDLNWNLRCETLSSTPLYITTDGSVLYYRLV